MFIGRDGEYITREEWVDEWGKDRTVKQETIEHYWVSTIYVGLHGNVYETMVFDGDGSDVREERYDTLEEATLGHERAVQWVKDILSRTSTQDLMQ